MHSSAAQVGQGGYSPAFRYERSSRRWRCPAARSTTRRRSANSTRKSPEAVLVEVSASHELKCDLAADVIRRFGTLRLRVNGFSMLLSIWPGDIECVLRVVSTRTGAVVLVDR